MKQVTAWEGSDGKLYKSAVECNKSEARTDFEVWYNNLPDEDQLYTPFDGDNIDGEILANWIIDNKHTLKLYLKRFLEL